MADLYVATDGNDRWSGVLEAPNGGRTDGPFATLTRARDAVRELKKQCGGALPNPVAVMVRGGRYYLDQTFVLGPKDCGTQDCPVTYTAYPGERPVISGGRRLSGWKPYEGKILQCDIPRDQPFHWRFGQLFCNGQRQTRSRYPKRDPSAPLAGWIAVEEAAGDPSYDAFDEGDPCKSILPIDSDPLSYHAFKYKPGTFPRRWANPRQGEVFVVATAGNTTMSPIRWVDEEERVITLEVGLKSFNIVPWNYTSHFGSYHRSRMCVENLLEELDQPGEWCADTEAGKVYFWPPTENVEGADIVTPALACLVDLSGASWVTISGLTLTETIVGGGNMHREGYEGTGAMMPSTGRTYCGEALHMRGAEYCRIVDNHFTGVGGNAIYLESYNLQNTIQGNEIEHAGSCGIAGVGSRFLKHVPFYPVNNQIVDNHIHHCGVFDKYVAGVFLGLSCGNVIGHNLIHDMPHHAINLGNSGYGRNVVEYNRIHHVCLETFDNGAINCWMEDPNGLVGPGAERSGHIFRGNFITDTCGAVNAEGTDPYMGHGGITFGIYLDNHSSNCVVYGNIVVRSGRPEGMHSSSIRVNGGKNNVIENNILVDSKVGVGLDNPAEWVWPHMEAFMASNYIVRNIIWRGAGGENPAIVVRDNDKHIARVVSVSDCNLFFNPKGQEVAVSMHPGSTPRPPLSLAEWRKLGCDIHSLVADPMFVDAEHDDYRLRPESPALKLGFQPIDAGQIGIRPRDKR